MESSQTRPSHVQVQAKQDGSTRSQDQKVWMCRYLVARMTSVFYTCTYTCMTSLHSGPSIIRLRSSDQHILQRRVCSKWHHPSYRLTTFRTRWHILLLVDLVSHIYARICSCRRLMVISKASVHPCNISIYFCRSLRRWGHPSQDPANISLRQSRMVLLNPKTKGYVCVDIW